jgi:hypothetical protein
MPGSALETVVELVRWRGLVATGLRPARLPFLAGWLIGSRFARAWHDLGEIRS